MSAAIKSVTFAGDMIVASLTDGRIISVPLAWYPKLLRADKGALNDFRLIGRGVGIHWHPLDDIG